MEYFDIQKHWRRLKPFYTSDEAYQLWKPSLVCFKQSWLGERGNDIDWDEPRYDLPRGFDPADWRYLWGPGRKPKFWDYVCHSACHYLVSLNLLAAYEADPYRDWQIVSSDLHSTVWDGDNTLFDANFLALGVSTDECWEMAAEQASTEWQEPGVYHTYKYE